MPDDFIVLLPAEGDNPRAVIGDNDPHHLIRMIAESSLDFSDLVTAYLEAEYAQFAAQIEPLKEAFAQLPNPIVGIEDKEAYATIVKKVRDLAAKLEAFHKKEKNPFWRGGQGADQYFFGLIDLLQKRSKQNRPGLADVGLARIGEYDDRILAEEMERRRLAEVEATRIAQEAQRKAAADAEAARQAQLAAERARTDASRVARQAEAAAAATAAAATAAQATTATQQAQERRIESIAPPAPILRNRGADGTLSTSAQVPYAELADRGTLLAGSVTIGGTTMPNLNALAPFLSTEALQKALTAWAKTHDYNVQMPGALIGRRAKPVVR